MTYSTDNANAGHVSRRSGGPAFFHPRVADHATAHAGYVANQFGITQFRITIVTDAWQPQISGVVRTYEWLARELPKHGVVITFITPEGFATIGLPTYRDIRLSLASQSTVARMIESAAPDIVHIATEGPLGYLARRYCIKQGRPFTTCYHTRYPEYIAARIPVPPSWTYAALRRFHNAAQATMAATPGLVNELARRGFTRLTHWRRGIDVTAFAEGATAALALPKPIFMFVGRIAVEKNLEAFLSLDLPGSRIVVGDGPDLKRLERTYPEAHFPGAISGPQLGALYRAADVFVFPSRTDTYGLVIAEALAAGTPVAAYPTAGARAIFGDYNCGVLDDDLRKAALAALDISRSVAKQAGAQHSIEASAASFLGILKSAAGIHAA